VKRRRSSGGKGCTLLVIIAVVTISTHMGNIIVHLLACDSYVCIVIVSASILFHIHEPYLAIRNATD
jgi:hypothetical protein